MAQSPPEEDSSRSQQVPGEQPSLLTEVINYDEATVSQVEKIQKEIAESSELVGEVEDFTSLEREYAEDDLVYQAKIKVPVQFSATCSTSLIPRLHGRRNTQPGYEAIAVQNKRDLSSKYSRYRRTRGDGNCFFRAFAFAYMESILKDNTDLPRFRDAVVRIKDSLLAAGYPSFTLEDFHDTFIDVLESTSRPETTVETLTKSFQDQATSDYVVCYLRILTSGYLQNNADFFQAFIEGGRTVKEYCSQEVEPMYHESDHIHISGLTAAVGVSIRVQYMDRGEGGKVNHHDFPEGTEPRIHILYRPGHYDILYP